MGYYYTIKEYASLKGLDLSLQDEAEAVVSATILSNKRGIPINKIYCGNTDRNINCFATRILQETFRPLGKSEDRQAEKKPVTLPTS